MKNIAEKQDTVYFHLSGNTMPHHTDATSGSPVFRIAAADIGNCALRGYPLFPFS